MAKLPEYKAVIYLVGGKAKKIVVYNIPGGPVAIEVPGDYDVEINYKIVKRRKMGSKEIIVAKLNAFELIALLSDYIHLLSQLKF